MKQLLPICRPRAQHVALSIEYVLQVAIPRGVLPQKFRVDIDDDAFIGRTGGKLRPVHTAAADDHDVPRFQTVALAFHGVAAAAGNEHQHLAKFVVVETHLSPRCIPQMEQAELLQQVPTLLIVFFHTLPLQRARFAYMIA